MKFVRLIPVLILTGLLSSGPVVAGSAFFKDGYLHIESGEYKVGFVQQANFTLHQASWRGIPFLIPQGWYQTVIYDGNAGAGTDPFIGSGHTKENVISIEVETGGKRCGVKELIESGTVLEGSVFTVCRETKLGPFFHYSSKVTVSAEGIREEFSYRTEGDTSGLQYMYVFMHCFSKEMLYWMCGTGDGNTVRGQFVSDRSFSFRKDMLWSALYDPVNQIGVLYTYPELYEGLAGHKNKFWNRPRDNKLYFTVNAKRPVGETFSYTVSLRAFGAEPAAWEQSAEHLLKEYYNGRQNP